MTKITRPAAFDPRSVVHTRTVPCALTLVDAPNFVPMKRLLWILTLITLALPLAAQRFSERKRPEIFPTDGKMRRGGLYVSPGVTWTLAPFKEQEERELLRDGDTVHTALLDPQGKLGLYLEAGWFHATNDPVILDYWDFGLAYKQLRGAESFVGRLQRADSTGATAGEGTFNDQHLTAHVNANKLLQVKDYQFVQLSLGANLDWRFGTERTYTTDLTRLNGWRFPPEWIGQVHFKVGYGFKLTQQLMIIPAIETPVFSVQPEDDGNWGRLDWFSSTYRPLIFSVRFLFLRYPKGWACPPVKNNEFEKHKVVNPSYERR